MGGQAGQLDSGSRFRWQLRLRTKRRRWVWSGTNAPELKILDWLRLSSANVFNYPLKRRSYHKLQRLNHVAVHAAFFKCPSLLRFGGSYDNHNLSGVSATQHSKPPLLDSSYSLVRSRSSLTLQVLKGFLLFRDGQSPVHNFSTRMKYQGNHIWGLSRSLLASSPTAQKQRLASRHPLKSMDIR